MNERGQLFAGALRKLTGASEAAAGRFPPWSRTLLTLLAILSCIYLTYVRTALATGHLIDERTWVDRSLKSLWGPPYDDRMRYYAVHHPSFARIVYGFTLHRMGVYEFNAPLVDYTQTKEWNFERGAFVPREIEIPLRMVNVAFLSGMIAFVYFGIKRIFGNRALAFAACLPLLFNYPIRDGACSYIGTDSMLLFWLAAFWYVWTFAARKGTLGVLALAAVGGFLISTKVNGAFVVAGSCVYYAATARGMRRLWWPAMILAVSGAIFVALNPVYRANDLAWAIKVARSVVQTMFTLKEKSTAHDWAQFTRAEVLKESLPYWFFYMPALAVMLGARKEWWFWPTAAWAGAAVIFNWVLIYIPLLRYSAPISMSFLVLFAAAGIHVILDTYRGSRQGEDGARGRTGGG